MRETTDHGRHWFAVPAPPAPYAAPGRSPVAGAVSSVRFADTQDGWAFGPGLWATHNGGRTWRQLSLGGWPVQSLEADGGRVLAVTISCLRCSRFRVYAAPVARDRWRQVPGGYGTGGTAAAQTGPAVTVAAGTGFVTVPAPLGPRQPRRPSLLTGPADGSARWHRLSTPCPKWAWNAQAAATPGLALVLGCAGQPGAGNQMKDPYFSPGRGGTWQPLAGLSSGGYLGTVSITPAGTIVLSGYLIPVDVSWDGGRTRHGQHQPQPGAGIRRRRNPDRRDDHQHPGLHPRIRPAPGGSGSPTTAPAPGSPSPSINPNHEGNDLRLEHYGIGTASAPNCCLRSVALPTSVTQASGA